MVCCFRIMLSVDLVRIVIDKTSTTHFILKYRKNQSNPPKPNHPRWQFVKDNKTMILTSAERNDSGTYTLDIFDANGTNKGSYTLQLNIEAMVSSVKVWYSCLSAEVTKVHCSADGDNLQRFIWTANLSTLTQLGNAHSTFLLDKNHQGNITCNVENHVSHDRKTIELHPCSVTTSTQSNNGLMVFASVWLFEVIILLSLFVGAFYIYTRIYRQQIITDIQEAL